tara:strand:+ start:25628 stop:25807 length:180 start_codon:yes stop_codon:yes gene_type:complete
MNYGKSFEDTLADHLTAREIADTKQMLRLIIDLSGKDVPISCPPLSSDLEIFLSGFKYI